MVAHICEYTKIQWPYTSNDWLVWHVNSISIKLFKPNKTRMALLTSIKIDFRAKKMTRDRDYIMTEGQFSKDTTILNVYIPSNWGTKYVNQNQTELTGEQSYSYSWTSEEPSFNNCQTENFQGYRRTQNSINQQGLNDIKRSIYPAMAEYTFFSSARGVYIKKDNIMDHKINLNKF